MAIHIISGGQTGVDMAALLAAEKHSLPYSGFTPKDYTNETGAFGIPDRFRTHLLQTGTTATAERTERNITIADGILTLLEGEDNRSEVSRGTQHGLDYATRIGKSVEQLCFVDLRAVDLDVEVLKTVEWIRERKIEKCAIGGPRESEVPGIEERAFAFLDRVFGMLL